MIFFFPHEIAYLSAKINIFLSTVTVCEIPRIDISLSFTYFACSTFQKVLNSFLMSQRALITFQGQRKHPGPGVCSTPMGLFLLPSKKVEGPGDLAGRCKQRAKYIVVWDL